MPLSTARSSRIPRPPAAGRPSPAEPAPSSQVLPQIGRWNDNELILFFEEWQESWIVYPPRSAYDFLRRPTRDAAVVEFHSWIPLVPPDQHPVRPREGCLLHGMDCRAHEAIQAAVDTGFDPFR